ncbi:MAG: cation:proton antiporter [Candidatus Marsarchaeota archaeon]|nr:cation:proton antiporter [Candidatus Marsarchaeota archaeon]
MIDTTLAFTLIAGIVFFGFGAEIFFRKTGIPHFLFLILIGILIGPVLGLISRNSFVPLLGLFSTFTLMMVLFYNGMQMQFREILSSSARSLVQVAIYVLVSVIAIAAVAHIVLGWDIIESLIFGSIIGGETTVPIMMRVPKVLNQDDNIVAFLGIEAVMNSILLVILFFVFLGIYQTGSASLSGAFSTLAANISVGVIFGVVLSMAWVLSLNYLKDYRYIYVFTLGLILTTYVLAQASGGSGIMAVLLFGIMLGNYKGVGSFLHRELKISGLESQLRNFQGEMSFLLETFFFVFLGMTFLIVPAAAVGNFLVGALFVAVLLAVRYLAVNVSTHGSTLYKSRTLITLMCAQGLTPAILAVVTLTDRLPLSNEFVNIVVFVILLTNIITAVGSYATMRSNKKGEKEKVSTTTKRKQADGAVTV